MLRLRLLIFLAPAMVWGQAGQVPAAPTAPPDPKDLCSIEGKVLDALTGKGLRNATVSLITTAPAGGAFAPAGNSAAPTDAEGNFSIKGIASGSYRLSATRTGYLSNQYGSRRPGGPGTSLSLSPGQNMTKLEFRMRKQGVIAGRVLDDLGEPVERAMVQAMRYQYVNGDRRLMPGGQGNTDDQGNYRIFGLVPDRYILRAAPSSPLMITSGADQPAFIYQPIYYPGTPDESRAAPLELTSGAEVPGINFTLAKKRAFRIQGQVLNQTSASGTIMILLRETAPSCPCWAASGSARSARTERWIFRESLRAVMF